MASRKHLGSLLLPESMGGITAGKGFDFQTRYTACHLPVWLVDAAFHQLLVEGTGDIDIRFSENGQSVRTHIQVKDHEVTVAEFKAVLVRFRVLEKELPGVYKCFTLVCPSLSAKLRPIENGLSRFKKVKPFYDDAANALAPTKADLDARLRKLKLTNEEIEFVCDKVSFEIAHGDLHHDERALDLFIARLLKHPEYAEKLRASVQPAFAEVLRAIQDKRGAVLGREDANQILRDAIIAGVPEKSVTIWVQNWTSEQFDLPADYSLDWSGHFDRASRKVPSSETWNNDLLPELQSLKSTVSSRRERLIRFRGKCTLSTGVALGATFPAVGSWIFEIPQPPAKEPWRSDFSALDPYDLQVEQIDGGPSGEDLVLGLNIRGDGREDVRRYVAGTGNHPKLFAFMAPPTQGSQSIAGAAEACAFAHAVREHLGQLIKTHDIRGTRLFFYGPFALAVFLGQQLTSVGEIHLYEYQDPGYVPSCLLRT